MESYKFCPLVIGSYRKIDYEEIGGMTKKINHAESRIIYRKAGLPILEGIKYTQLPKVKQWLINKYFKIEKEWANFDRLNWNWFIDNIKSIGPKGLDFKFIEIRDDLEPLFSINGVNCYLEELSAGFQSVLSLVLKIFDWVEQVNNEDEGLVENAKGVVIIDELDVHLHPEWQFTIRNTLDKFFPYLQFIITSHSPHLISTARENEIIILPPFKREISVEPSPNCYAGWTTEQILEDLMGVQSINETIYEKLFKEAQIYVEQRNVDELNNLIKRFSKIAHPSDTIIEKLKIQLAKIMLNDEE